MNILALLILIISVGYLIVRTKKDVIEYEKFKKIKSSTERIKVYKKWVASSFLQFGVFSLFSLLILKQINVLWAPLPALLKVTNANKEIYASLDKDFLVGLFMGVLTLTAITVYINKKQRKNNAKLKHLIIGDVEALIPKDNQERVWGSLLAINAGFSEELFFRALLPVLLYLSFGIPAVAIIVSSLIFGLVHYYQGAPGVFVTFLMGSVLMVIYLTSGNIIIPMLIHATIDLISLIIRPAIVESLSRRT